MAEEVTKNKGSQMGQNSSKNIKVFSE